MRVNMTRRDLLSAAALCAAPLYGRTRFNKSTLSAITDEIGKTTDDSIAFAHQYGLKFIELRNIPEDRKEYALSPEEKMKAHSARFAREGLKVSFINTGMLKFTWPGTEPARRRQESEEARKKRLAAEKVRWEQRMDYLHKSIACAHIMGCDKVRVFSGTRVADPKSMHQRIADEIGAMSKVAEKAKVYLVLENEGSQNIGTSAEVAEVLKLIPSKWVGFNWDPQNSLGLKEKPYPDGYDVLPRKRMLNVQVKGKGVMPASPEKLDWLTILKRLEKDGYRGKVGLETHIFDGTLIEAAHISMKELVRMIGQM
jgi:sugar phosphate isomerase/epimerase